MEIVLEKLKYDENKLDLIFKNWVFVTNCMWFFSICVLNIIQLHNISYFLEKSINPGWCSDGLFFQGGVN